MTTTDNTISQIDADAAASARIRGTLEQLLADSTAVILQCDVTDGRAWIRVAAPEADHDDNGCTDYLTEAFQSLDGASDEGQECVQMVGANATGWVSHFVHTWSAAA